jgi:dCMP deaminase
VSAMNDWNSHFMEMAKLVSTRSKDPARKVGAVIVDNARRVTGMGYNGFPRGVRDDSIRYADEFVKLKLVVHAEANAILNARVSVATMSLYCTSYPCSECAKLIIQAGILTIHSPPPSAGKWSDDAQFSNQMFAEAMVEWFRV